MTNLTTVSEYALGRSKRSEIFKRYGLVFLFLAPYFIFFLLFCIYPLVYGIVMSFMKFNIGDSSRNAFLGFENFSALFTDSKNDPFVAEFWYSLGNTLKFAVILVPLGIVLPLIFAVLINSKPKGYKVFRALIYLPSIFPISASGAMFISIFGGQDFGYLNQWIGANINWLQTPSTAWFVIIMLCLWGGWGGNFMILSAALKNIDKSLYEAASVDGCTGFKRIFKVTLPAIKPQLILCLFTTIIGYFGLYGQIYVLTGGGPSHPVTDKQTTETVMVFLQDFIKNPNRSVFGMASAMGLTLGIIIGVVTGLQLYFTRDRKSGIKKSVEFKAYISEKSAKAEAKADGEEESTVTPQDKETKNE